jgi:hypothetical protein
MEDFLLEQRLSNKRHVSLIWSQNTLFSHISTQNTHNRYIPGQKPAHPPVHTALPALSLPHVHGLWTGPGNKGFSLAFTEIRPGE